MRVVERRLAQALEINSTLITVLLTPAGGEGAELVIMVNGKTAPAESEGPCSTPLTRTPADDKPN
jgi:hypothetical protein